MLGVYWTMGHVIERASAEQDAAIRRGVDMNRMILGVLVVGLAVVLGGVSGCDVAQAKAEREMQLSAPLLGIGSFQATTHNGAIKVAGLDTDQCDLIARIQARAATQERAVELAEATDVVLEASGEKLIAVVKKPQTTSRESISVSLDVTLATVMVLTLETHNGAVTVLDIDGRIDAETHNGAIDMTNIVGDVVATSHNGRVRIANGQGDVTLRSHNGAVVCDGINGDTDVSTSNGGVRVVYSDPSLAVCRIKVVTHNGSVDVTAPKGLSAQATLSTHNGSINTSLPITVEGKVSKKRIAGKIGDGKGSIHLETYNGSIKLR